MSDETRQAARPIVAKESRVTGREVVEVSYTYDELLAIFDGDDNVVRPLVLRCQELEAALAAAHAAGRAEMERECDEAISRIPTVPPGVDTAKLILNSYGRRCYDAGRAEGLREAAQWQPMATAPKDGTEVLLTNGSYKRAGWWAKHRNCWSVDAVVPMAEPTHWMPLPAAPAGVPPAPRPAMTATMGNLLHNLRGMSSPTAEFAADEIERLMALADGYCAEVDRCHEELLVETVKLDACPKCGTRYAHPDKAGVPPAPKEGQ